MIKYFPIEIEREISKHAIKEFPNESCGLIVRNEYVPCQNIATNTRWNFEIDSKIILKRYIAGDLQCIVHSHCDEVGEHMGERYVKDYGHASKDDMIRQASCKVPFGIVHLNIDASPVKIFYFGDQLPVQDLKGRTFIHGVYDCMGLLRDYYKTIFDITLPQFPRQFGWWNDKKNSSMFLDLANSIGFYETQIDKYNPHKHGDAIFMTIRSHTVNHVGVYTKNGLMMHHLCNRLSIEEPVMIYKDSIGATYRHEELK